MSLDNKPKGNPNWTKGKSGNPDGRPVGAKSLKSILKVAATLAEKKRHPVDELVRIADKAEAASANVVITKPGCTTWKVGEITSKTEFAAMCAAVKTGEMPEAKAIPGTGGTELAAKIWADLLKYCEPQKKAVESAPEKPTTPQESVDNAEKLLSEMEEIGNGTSATNTREISGDTIGLANGTPNLSTQASTTPDLSGDKDK